MKAPKIHPLPPAAGLLILLLASGCARSGAFERVEFTAPARPDAALRPYLEKGRRLGVVCWTDIASAGRLDIEKVMARLSNAVSRRLGELPGSTILSQDEILWRIGQVQPDSASAISQETRALLRKELNLDALVFIKLKELQARVTPMAPTPYGLVSTPGLDLSIGLEIDLVNLHTGEVFRQSGQQRDWQPIRLQLFGNDPAERQLLMALSGPIGRFLDRLAPSPRRQVRYFDLSGD